MTSDGKPYGPERYKEIVQERYIISKNSNTSYTDVGEISPLERKYLLDFIFAELKKKQEIIDKQNAATQTKKRKRGI